MLLALGVTFLLPGRLWDDQGIAILAKAIVAGTIVWFAQSLRLRRHRRGVAAGPSAT